MPRPFSFPSLEIAALAAIAVSPCLAQTAAVRVATPASCPVELSAAQAGMSQLVHAAPGTPEPPKRAAQGGQEIDLSMKNTRLQRIVGAELEVHGTLNKSRIVPLKTDTANDPADGVRHVQLVSSVPANEKRTRTVAVEDLTSVAYLSITELRYADGSVWTAGPGRACKVVPSSLMEVANR